MDRRLLERTVEIAAASGAFGAAPVAGGAGQQPALGRWAGGRYLQPVGPRPAQGAGRDCAPAGAGAGAWPRRPGAALVAGPSLKAALDLDWDDAQAQQHALTVLEALQAVDHWLDPSLPGGDDRAGAGEPGGGPAGARAGRQHGARWARPTLRHGVAADRRISVEDAEMRHGRKSRSLLVDGYKRHVLRDLDSRLIVAVGVTPANAPEASVTDAIEADLAAQQ